MKETPFDFKPNTDYRMWIETNGKTNWIFCNNELLNSLHDDTFKSGKVGFRESNGESSIFRGITVTHRDSVLLKSYRRNPDLWLHNHNFRIVKNHLEV